MEIAFGIGGSLLSSAFEILFDKLASADLIKYARQGHILDELKKWEMMLRKIYTVLDDAEEKQMTDHFVKIWSAELRDLAYDVEDIIDEFDTEARRRKLLLPPQPTTSKLRKLVPTCCVGLNLNPNNLYFNSEMLVKIESISIRLENIIKQKDGLRLEMSSGDSRRNDHVRGKLPSTSLVNEAKVYGRQKDKIAILELMNTQSSEDDIYVIPIVGMGGIGKTTLAQLIFNDETLEFDFKSWVSVGEDFDPLKITKTILQNKDCDGEDLNSLQIKLKEKMCKKKFFVVLDDVWTEKYEDWTLFKTPFESGAKGSRIIITTRNEGVSLKMGSVSAYYLRKLSHDDCLSILAQHALGTRDFDAHLHLKEIGEQIVNRCGGLPLAAKSLGGVLRGNPYPNVWEQVLSSKIWELPEECGILPALRLSYYHLPSHLKRCFACCSVFPKGFSFQMRYLLVIWLNEGLLSMSWRKKDVSEIGVEYFNELVSRSFFELLDDGRFVMHDLVHDLACYVAGEAYYGLPDDFVDRQFATPERIRYLPIINHWTEDLTEKAHLFCEMKRLRIFYILYGPGFADKEFDMLLRELKCLRSLCVAFTSITHLPSSVSQLKHLRSLCLSGGHFKSLPESVGFLFNLRALLLGHCKELQALPESIKNLINLEFLGIQDTENLRVMPAGLGNLTNLLDLAKFIVGDGLRLRELKGLIHLSGDLLIQRLHNVANTEDAKEANLKEKNDLTVLEMQWSDNFHDSRNVSEETLVLNSLEPSKNLEKLTVSCFGGTRFPAWMGSHLFMKLVEVNLVSCANSILLPSLGRLPSLRSLLIEGAGVETIGTEFYGDGFSFQALEILKFRNLMVWEHWTCSKMDFPLLRELELHNCPKLKGEVPRHFPSLEYLIINACPLFECSLINVPCLDELYINESSHGVLRDVIDLSSLTSLQLYRIRGLAFLNRKLTESLEVLISLNVEDCSELEALWEDGNGIKSLVHLEHVVIKKCSNLVTFSRYGQDLPVNLKHLELEECENLEVLPTGLHRLALLEDLRIKNCPKLRSFPETGLPRSVLYIHFRDWHKTESHERKYNFGSPGMKGKICISVTENSQIESLLSSMLFGTVNRIKIPICVTLRCLTKSNGLKKLTIKGCPGTERACSISEWELHRLSSLERLELDGINMVSFPGDDGRFLPTSLEHLSIRNIKNLKAISRGIRHLTCLQQLEIYSCTELSTLPKEGLPVSLQRLDITFCPLLAEGCSETKGDFWPVISHIPEKHIDDHNSNLCLIQ